jgi:anti-sigma factor (TIGR02949 family)
MSEQQDAVTPEEIGCLESIETLYAYLDGEIRDPADAAKIEHHLSHCRSCYSRAELERRLSRRLRSSGSLQAPDALRDRLKDLMDKL